MSAASASRTASEVNSPVQNQQQNERGRGLNAKEALQVTARNNKRRSLSMVSSLDKLTKKLKNNLLDMERETTLNKKRNMEKEDSALKMDSFNNGVPQQSPFGCPHKQFKNVTSEEYLFVTHDGCFTYQDQSKTSLVKLQDARDVLGAPNNNGVVEVMPVQMPQQMSPGNYLQMVSPMNGSMKQVIVGGQMQTQSPL